MQVPDIAPPVIAPALTATDLEADANAWTTAAQAAYGTFSPVTAITELTPLDTAIAVLGEATLYDALGNLNDVALLHTDGSLLNLDQGLGLALGTQLSVTGYTDVTGPAGHDPIEVLALTVVSMPIPTDTDTNANLLDDDWEKFFFGALGVVGPFDPHPVSGYTYLQYMLSGADPRADSGDAPDEILLDLSPPLVTLVTLPNTNFGLQFPFPDLYFDSFDWGVQEAGADLLFTDLATDPPSQIAPNLYQIDLGAPASSFALHFFRLTMALKE